MLADVESFVNRIENCGLIHIRDRECKDSAVVDQQQGFTTQCKWVEFGSVSIDGNMRLSQPGLFICTNRAF